ncbi:hypothetical protein ACAG26_18570 [Mycobacterium sp. pUA109]|uniref:hypothetical protein n=1 Tax=Mycobacterium sp. pUA109 TaxID=3238982 RepID=UPI00351AB8A9
MTIAGTAAVLAATMIVTPPALARADGPAAGSSCDSGQLNLSTKSSAGTAVRCLADEGRGYVWQVDNGTTQTPEQAARIAQNACQRLGATAECRSVLDKIPHHH